jgi:hypothetical protein
MKLNRMVLAAPAAGAIVALGLTGVDAAPAPDIPAHRHYLVVDGTMVPVGPQLCDEKSVQQAFNQFHYGVHVGEPGTEAWQHEHNQVGITARACSFVP